VLVASEETNESLSTWPRAAAAQQSSEREGSEQARDRMRREEGCSGRKGKQVMHRRWKKKTHGLLVGRFFSFVENFFFKFFFLSLLIFYYSC
jgi:hypothetical protein